MINVKIDIEQFDTNAAALEIEHIGQLINQGYTQGEGWTLSGDEEKEPDTISLEEDDDINQANDMVDSSGDMIGIKED